MKKKKTSYNFLESFINFFLQHQVSIYFLIIVGIAMFFRFYRIEEAVSFGWDQARDSWKVWDLLRGEIVLHGPRAGVGQFHLGPLYFYLLAPFYYFTALDPMGSNYLNILMNLFNFGAIFYVVKKMYSTRHAFISLFIYSFSRYLIETNRTPWNVTLIPGLSILIFYSIWKIYQKEYKWFYVLAILTGIFFHIHFSALFLLIIIPLSFIFLENKKLALKYAFFSSPLFFVWLIPNIIAEFSKNYGDTNLVKNFWKDYYLGFHLRFMFHRLHDAFIQFQMILNVPPKYSFAKFIIPLIYSVYILFVEGEKREKLIAYLISLWFFVPLIFFTLYSGSTSEYYMLLTAPLVLMIIAYLHEKLFYSGNRIILVALMVLAVFYFYHNTNSYWFKPEMGGLSQQKADVQKIIKDGGKVAFNEGDIKSYLYAIWTKKN